MSCEQTILKSIFGLESFRGNQASIISTILRGQDAVVLMPTGGGKSLCYQIPALAMGGTGIIVSPLIALMKDQVDALREKGIAAAFLNSSITLREQRVVEEDLVNGCLKLLYVSPERLVTTRFISLLNRSSINLFAIDEAHCVSQWGHDFRPEYMELSILHEYFPDVPRIALTATAGEATRKEIIRCLKLEKAKLFISTFDRPNIRYEISKKTGKAFDYKKLRKFIEDRYHDSCGIVYCLSRKKTEEVASFLREAGFNAHPYHAGLSSTVRSNLQERFLVEKNIIIVATVAFGMGIDRADVRFVIHMDLPKCIESYYQETGRAGRDGLPSTAWMVYGLQDLVLLKRLMNGGNISAPRKRVNEEKLDAILGMCESTTCRREVLLSYFLDPYIGPCDNCDTCSSQNKNLVDATELAIKALRTVFESKKKYGVAWFVSILKGDTPEATWYSIFRQLISLGSLKMEMDGRSELMLTEKAIPIIKGTQKVWLRMDRIKSKTTKAKKKVIRRKKRVKKVESYIKIDGSNETLFNNLKLFRKNLAKKRRTKAYKIFPDRTLLEFINEKPTSLDDLENIYGVGPKKIKKYGKLFLDALIEFG
jgi:ATP-dependent DNA helicase RecQ